ncbi:MAG: PKD domain-containing protein [Desulfococcaceae bacterium]
MSRKHILIAINIVFILFTSNLYAKSVEDAINWAENEIGSNWDSQCRHAWGWWCMHFCGHAYGRVPAGMDAIDGWKYSDSVFGERHTDWNAPKGALVFFQATSGNGWYGHVGISDGNGKMYHAWTTGVRKDSISFGGQYLGWRWPDAWTSDEPGSSGNPGKPDLVVREVYLTDNRVNFLPGESFRIYTKVKNVGDADAGHDIKIKYYLSNGSKIDDNPVRLGDDTIYKEDLKEGKSDDEKTDVKAPNTPGTYNITVLADTEDDVDEEDEGNNWYDPPLVFVVGVINAKPIGYIDIANCTNISGWAKDPDTSSPINVDFYVDGPAGGGGTFLTKVAANKYRSDVGTHGFSFATPEILKDENLHRIYAYGLDSEGGDKPLIGSGSVLCVKPTPLGSPVFRFYHTQKGFHFFTINEAEKDFIIKTWPVEWKYEGVAWYAYPSQIDKTQPVYRFCHNLIGSHFYTINQAEKDFIIKTWPVDWRYEGVAWYAYPSQIDKTQPVYRFCHNIIGSHFYTVSVAERDHIIKTWPVDWRYEGIAWYLKTDHSITNAIAQREFSASTPEPLPPVSAFSATPVSGNPPLTVTFKDESEGNVSVWEWDFGDDTTSADTNPVHTYNTDGVYSVTLRVNGYDGWQTLTKENYIIVKPLYLEDAIKALQVLAGMKPDGISVNPNERIGLERVIYILQEHAELRD